VCELREADKRRRSAFVDALTVTHEIAVKVRITFIFFPLTKAIIHNQPLIDCKIEIAC